MASGPPGTYQKTSFLKPTWACAEADLTSYEKLSGGAPLFDDSERDYTFYNLSVGWNAVTG